MNTLDMIPIINPVLGLAVNVLVQILSFRLIPSMGLLKSVFMGFGVGMLYVLGSEYFIFTQSAAESMRDFLPNVLSNILTCGVLGYCYFHFINLGETGRRIRIVRELLNAGGLSMEGLLQRYNTSDMVEIRLTRLLNSGQIIERNGMLFIQSQFLLRASRIMVLMKKIILGKTSEFD